MTVYSVPDMSCAHCEKTIRQSLAALPGIDKVEIDLAAKKVAVEGPADSAKIIAALDDAGYAATPLG